MNYFKILKYPNYKLRKIAKPVKKINKKIQYIIHKMFETMYMYNGIGLAATQININLQIIVIDITNTKNHPIVLINPKQKKSQNTQKTEEGCLSIPGFTKHITRANTVKIQSLNYFGKKIYIQAKSLLSICIQHEMDHLIGKLIIDY